MNPYIKEYAELVKDYEAKNGKRETVLALYEFSDRLKKAGDKDAKTVLVDVYKILSLMQSAYDLMSEIADRNDKKQIKKLAYLKSLAEDDGDRWAVKRPKTAAEESLQREKAKKLPKFRYHPDPLTTESFEEGPPEVCPCCGKESTIYYSSFPYSVEDVEHLCPECIASGEAAKKFDAQFVQDAEWEGEVDVAKSKELFERTPGYLSWQGEHWLSCCNDYCTYLGTVGTQELEEMGIADEVLEEYEMRHEYTDIREYLYKDGDLCGYLFRCLHCGKYHIYVDAS